MKRTWAILALVGAIVVPASKAIPASNGRPKPVITHVVRSGETLWGIARALHPHEDPRAGVEALLRLNRLASPGIRAGQILHLPAR